MNSYKNMTNIEKEERKRKKERKKERKEETTIIVFGCPSTEHPTLIALC
jgi:L-fucose isomerase-like protein